MTDRGPLPHRQAWPAMARCVLTSATMLSRREIGRPREYVGRMIRFGDGSSGRVYRETRVARPPEDPCVLVVAFRLRGVRGRGHAWFESVSLLNTPLFVGFPGFVSKLWLAHDGNGIYRGLYEWDGPQEAEQYARALWRVLALVSTRGSIHFRVFPGVRRDDVLTEPGRIDGQGLPEGEAWSRVVAAL